MSAYNSLGTNVVRQPVCSWLVTSRALAALIEFRRTAPRGMTAPELLRAILPRLHTALSSQRAVALHWNPVRAAYLPVAAAGIAVEAFSTLQRNAFPTADVARVLAALTDNDGVLVDHDPAAAALPKALAAPLGRGSRVAAKLNGASAVPSAVLILTYDRNDEGAAADARAAFLGGITAHLELLLENRATEEALDRQGRRLATLTSLSLDLSSDLGHDPLSLLTKLRERVPELDGSAAEAILLMDEVEPLYTLWGQLEGKPFQAAYEVPPVPNALTAATHGGRPIVVRNATEVARLGGLPTELAVNVPGAASALAVPLLVRQRVIGALVLISRHANGYSNDQVPFFSAVAAQLAVILDQSRIYALLRSRGDVRRRLLGQTLHAQELERKSLVDGVLEDALQELAACVYRLNVCSRLSELGEHERNRIELSAIRRQLTERIDSLRAVIGALRPSSLDHLGLAAVLRDELASLGQETGIYTDFRDGLRRRLPPAIETRAFRIVQELLSNVKQHAGATRVSIELAQREREVVVSVIDDGIGFVVEGRSLDSTSMGLHAVREQAELEGGVIRLRSWPGAGTCVEVAFPHAAMRQPETP